MAAWPGTRPGMAGHAAGHGRAWLGMAGEAGHAAGRGWARGRARGRACGRARGRALGLCRGNVTLFRNISSMRSQFLCVLLYEIGTRAFDFYQNGTKWP